MEKQSLYAIWLMPSGKVHAELAAIISKLSKLYGTHVFEPHVTLAWPLTGTESEVIAKTQKLASFLVPFNVDLGKPEFMDEYYRCIFLWAEKADMLMGANMRAREIFAEKPANHEAILKSALGEKKAMETIAREKEPGYGPHMSIMYGSLPQNIKVSIMKTLSVPKMSFAVNSISLYEITANPKEWRFVKNFAVT